MPRCGCGQQTCACVIQAGDGVTVTGSGTPNDPYVVTSADGGASSGASGWSSGDLKETSAAGMQPGWLDADGSAVSRGAYSALFAAIGTTYGSGDGSTTFNLPDYRGRVKVGVGPGYDLGDSGGAETTTLGVDNLPPHGHAMGHVHSITHDHPAFNTVVAGQHDHDGHVKVSTNGLPDHHHNAPKDGGATSDAGSTNNGQSVARAASAGSDSANPLDWDPNGGGHAHQINVPSFVGPSGPASLTTTGLVGTGAPTSRLQPYRVVRVLIKT